jgi:hypothetical protein
MLVNKRLYNERKQTLTILVSISTDNAYILQKYGRKTSCAFQIESSSRSRRSTNLTSNVTCSNSSNPLAKIGKALCQLFAGNSTKTPAISNMTTAVSNTTARPAKMYIHEVLIINFLVSIIATLAKRGKG